MPLLNAVIDLSHHNVVSSFRAVRESGVLAVIHKATEGTRFVDAKYPRRRTAAAAQGLLWGAYHFGIAGDVPGQVDHFLATADPGPTDLLVLDFEPNPREGTMTTAEAEAFVEGVQARTGRFPGLYSGQSFLTDRLRGRPDSILGNCFLWIARYASALPRVPPPFPTFTLWQYTDGTAGPGPHVVSGIGRCDRDKFNGDDNGSRLLWGVARS